MIKNHLILGLIFAIVVLIYFLTSGGNTPYNYFVRLADGFLHGRYWLTENPPWLSELIPAGPNKFYTVHPPMPAILLMPFVYVWGLAFPQQYLAHLLGAGIVILTMSMAWRIKQDKILTIWSGLLIGFATIVWFLASVGSSWYLGQVTAAFFLTAALVEGLGKKRPWLLGLLLGATFLSRLQTILSLPLFIYLLWSEKRKFHSLISFGSTLFLFILFDAVYNYLRFGVPWEEGYSLIPGILSEPWFSKGFLNPLYIPRALKIAFLAFPKILNHSPFIQPSWAGMAIWLTTPVFIFSLRTSWKENIVKLSWLAILLIFLVNGSHGGTGFAQFGYRYAVDFYPFLTLLTIKGVSRSGLKWYHWLLLFWGVVVNLWGVLWINKFGWVSF